MHAWKKQVLEQASHLIDKNDKAAKTATIELERKQANYTREIAVNCFINFSEAKNFLDAGLYFGVTLTAIIGNTKNQKNLYYLSQN
jgi:hypothetical protein